MAVITWWIQTVLEMCEVSTNHSWPLEIPPLACKHNPMSFFRCDAIPSVSRTVFANRVLQYIVIMFVSHCLMRTDKDVEMWDPGREELFDSLFSEGLSNSYSVFKWLTSISCSFAHTRVWDLIRPLIQRTNLWCITSPMWFVLQIWMTPQIMWLIKVRCVSTFLSDWTIFAWCCGCLFTLKVGHM